MKRASLGIILAAIAASLLGGCGGGSNTSVQTQSNLQNRAFVTNTFFGNTVIVDASKDVVSSFSLRTGGNSRRIFSTLDKKNFAVFSEVSFTLAMINADSEKISAVVALPDWTESVVLTSNGNTGYAAIKNAPGDLGVRGLIDVLDFPNEKITSTISVPDVRRLAMNNAATRLLTFSDQSDVVRIVDLSKTPPTVTAVTGTFSRPIAGFFSSDDSKAYVLNCGVECGAPPIADDSRAAVTEVDMTTGAVTRTLALPSSGATVGLLDGNTLYVAGTPNGQGPGTIDTVDVTTLTATGATTAIGPRSHQEMAKANSKIWVGATGCGSGEGCLSIFNPSDRSAIVDALGSGTKGDVTSMSPVNGRTVMYVIEGGQLHSYNTNTGVEDTPFSLDIKGALYGVITVP